MDVELLVVPLPEFLLVAVDEFKNLSRTHLILAVVELHDCHPAILNLPVHRLLVGSARLPVLHCAHIHVLVHCKIVVPPELLLQSCALEFEQDCFLLLGAVKFACRFVSAVQRFYACFILGKYCHCKKENRCYCGKELFHTQETCLSRLKMHSETR